MSVQVACDIPEPLVILKNSRMQVIHHLDILHWETRWVTQVILLWLMIPTLAHLNKDASQIMLSRQL
jgi:hypothetical protein